VDTSTNETTSFDRLRTASLAIAGQLKRSGLTPGDRVGILIQRGALSAAAYFGVLAAGGAAVPISESLKNRQIDYILRHSGARVRGLRAGAAGSSPPLRASGWGRIYTESPTKGGVVTPPGADEEAGIDHSKTARSSP
jgi:non-ribosomal peptide synthetase component F